MAADNNKDSSSTTRDVNTFVGGLRTASNEIIRLSRATAKLEKSMDGASNAAVDKAAEALEALAKQSSFLEDAIKAEIAAHKQTPRSMAKITDRLESNADAVIAAQKKYRESLEDIKNAQQAAMQAANNDTKLQHKAKRNAQRDTAKSNRELKAQFSSLGLATENAARNIDALGAEARVAKSAILKQSAELEKPSAKIGKALEGMHSKVQTSIESLGEFSVVLDLTKKAVTELYSQTIRLANKGLVGSMASMNIAALKLRMTAGEFEDLVSANRDMIAVMGGGAQGIENFASVLKESSVGLEYLGKEGKKTAATILGGFNRAGFGLMSMNEDISDAYKSNIKGLNKQFKAFNGVFGDTAEEFTNLYEQQLKSESLQARLLSGDTKSAALQMKELMTRTETLKLMGLSNQQIIDMSKRADLLFNPQENRQGEVQSERVAARQALTLGAQTIQGTDPELASKIASFVESGEMQKFQQMDSESKKAYMVQNAELFKSINKMQETITSMRDKNGGGASNIGNAYVDRQKAAGIEMKFMTEYGKNLNEAEAKGFNQSKKGREALRAKGLENSMSDSDGETTLLGKSFGLLRDAVDSVTSIFNNPFTSALQALGALFIFSNTTIKSAIVGLAETLTTGLTGTIGKIANAGRTMFNSIGGFAKVAGGLLKGLIGFLKEIPLISAIVGSFEGAWESWNTETEDYYDRLGVDKKETGLLKDIGVRLVGTLQDVGAATVRTGTFGLIDPSKNFSDKQKKADSTSISDTTFSTQPQATKTSQTPQASQVQSPQPQVTRSPNAANTKGLKRPTAEVQTAITNAAATAGVDPGYMMAMGAQESSFNPNAKAGTSSAKGLYQFTNGTWAAMVKKYGDQYGIGMNDQFDPQKNALMGAMFTKDNAQTLKSKGLDTDASSLYAAHFLGAGGAAKMLSARKNNPNASAADLMPDAARANPNVFYNKDGTAKTLDEVYGFFNKQVASKVTDYNAMLGATGPGIGAAQTQLAGLNTQLGVTGPSGPAQVKPINQWTATATPPIIAPTPALGPTGPAPVQMAAAAPTGIDPFQAIKDKGLNSMTPDSTNGNPVVDELKTHTNLLNTMVSLLGKTAPSPRGYQMNQQTGINVGS